jgi:hypothetical protein
MTFFATLKEAQCYCQSYYDDDNQLRNCTCGVCPGGKQPEIKKFRKDFTYIGKEGRDWKALPRDVENFLKQALAKSFESGQKSREKEMLEEYNFPDEEQLEEMEFKRADVWKAINSGESVYLSEIGNLITEEEYFDFEDMAGSVGLPEGSQVERFIEVRRRAYPSHLLRR